MPTYVVLVTVPGGEAQNAQELASRWGEVENEIEDAGGTPRESYVVTGEYDFVVTYDVPDTETALGIEVGIERHGLEARTMPVVPVDRLGGLVDDV